MESTASVSRKPKKWIAAVLGLIFPPAGMLYVVRPGLAVGYFFLMVIIALAKSRVLRDPVLAELAGLLLGIVCAIHAYRIARDYEESHKRPWYSRWYGLVGIIAGPFVVLAVPRAFLFDVFRF